MRFRAALLTLAVVLITLGYAPASAWKQHATCRLSLQGHRSSSSNTSSRQNALGLASADLHCSSSGGPVLVGINSTTIQKAAQNFTGVRVVYDAGCQPTSTGFLAEPAFYALLYFCGDYELHLEQPLVQGITMDVPSPQSLALIGVIVVGGHVNATVTAGLFVNNRAGTLVLAMNNASVVVADTTADDSISTAAGFLWAIDNAVVSVHNTTMNRMNVFSNGGAVIASNQTAVSISNSTFSDNKAGWGAAVYAQHHSSLTVVSSNFITNAAAAGGAVYVVNQAQVSFSFCAFRFNIATSGNAGVIQNLGQSSLNITACTFENNKAAQKGGAIWGTANSKIIISQSLFRSNQAGNSAGALMFDSDAKATISNSVLTENTAKYHAGAISVYGAVIATVQDCNISSNSAPHAGSISVGRGSSLNIKACTFTDNIAQLSGGAVGANDSSWVSIWQTVFRNNSAQGPGGAVSLKNAKQVAVTSSTFADNVAASASSGGAVNIYGNSSITISNCSIQNNIAGTAGGVCVDQSSRALIYGCDIISNMALEFGGAVAAAGTSWVTMIDSNLANNSATKHGGGLYCNGSATLNISASSVNYSKAQFGGALLLDGDCNALLQSSLIVHNHADDSGGGVYLQGAAQVQMLGSAVGSNSARNGGGIYSVEQSTVSLIGMTLMHNIATDAGGAVALVGNSKLIVGSANQFTQNTAAIGGCARVFSTNFSLPALTAACSNNTARTDAELSSPVQHINLISNSTIQGFVSRATTRENLFAKLNVSGLFGIPSGSQTIVASLAGVGTLATVATDASGLASIPLSLQLPAGQHAIGFSLPDWPGVQPASMSVEVRSCVQGEVAPSPETCQSCLAGFYSLEPSSAVCATCPANADCPGGATIVPKLNFWHSSANSAQLHRCPNPAACRGDRSAVRACSKNKQCRTRTNYTQLQCSPGYQSNICSMCTEGYGHTKAFNCRPCLSPAVTIALYVIGAVVLLCFIKLLCHFTLAENYSVQMQEWSLSQPPSELLRCLVLYSQRLLLVASVNVEWPAVLSYPFKGLALIWSSTSPETLSIDCVLPKSQSMPGSVQRVVFYLSMPAVLMVTYLLSDLLFHLRSRQTDKVSILNRLASSAMVVMFFFLPAVLRIVFGIFACTPLDAAVAAPYVANAVGTFWVYDSSVNCFTSYHRALSLWLGIPMLMLLCLALPAIILYTTVTNRNRLNDVQFMRHYGFLTKSYKPNRCWWEAMITLETIVLVAISVFGANLGAMYQSIILSTALVFMAYLASTFAPYAHVGTSRAMMHGVWCLLLNSVVSQMLVLNSSVDASATYELVMGVVVLTVNLAYMCAVIWMTLKSIDWHHAAAVLKSMCSKLGCRCQISWLGQDVTMEQPPHLQRRYQR